MEKSFSKSEYTCRVNSSVRCNKADLILTSDHRKIEGNKIAKLFGYIIYNLARTPEIGQGLGRILSCGACKPERT